MTQDPGPSSAGLGGVAARGMAVTVGGQAVRILLQVGGTVVLARLLSPQDFGLVAMVAIVIAVADIFRDLGLSVASIRAEHLTEQQRDNLFWVNTLLGVLFAVLSVVGAGAVAWFFDEPRLVAITQVLSLTFVVNGLSTQYRSDLTRRLRFRALVGNDVLAQASGLAVGVTIAIATGTYWAIVAQQLTQASVSFLVQAVLSGWLPGRPRRRAGTMPLLRFGADYVVSQVITYVSNNVDTALVGYRFGPGPLGVYSRAFQLLMMPLTQLRVPTTSVALPTLARLERDPARAARFLERSQVALGYSLVGGLALVAGGAVPVVRIFLGPQWTAAVPLMQAFAVAGAALTLGYVGNWVFLVRDLTRDLVRWTAFSAVIRVACVLAGSPFGLIGVAIGFAAAPLVLSPASLWWLSRRTDLPVRALLWGYARVVLVAAAAATSGALAVAAVRDAVWVQALVAVVVVVGVYAAATIVPAVRRDVRDLLTVARSLRRSRTA